MLAVASPGISSTTEPGKILCIVFYTRDLPNRELSLRKTTPTSETTAQDCTLVWYNSGAFGVADACSAAIEEQGWKTLHIHFLIWIKDWSCLLERLRSADKQGIRKAAGKELQAYADNIMSTKLHGNLPRQICKKAFTHSCVISESEAWELTSCSLQDLRNLRYKDRVSSFGEKSIVKCDICRNGYVSEALVSNVVGSVCHPYHDGSAENCKCHWLWSILDLGCLCVKQFPITSEGIGWQQRTLKIKWRTIFLTKRVERLQCSWLC
jgi:hypothetical protein